MLGIAIWSSMVHGDVQDGASVAPTHPEPIPVHVFPDPSQEEERIEPGDDAAEDVESPPAPAWRLRLTDPYLEFEGGYDHRRVTSSSTGRTRSRRSDRSLWFREAVGFSLRAEAPDPDLLTFAGDLKLGLSQQRDRTSLDEFSRSDSDTGSLLEFNLSLDLFQSEPVSFSLHTRRARDRIPRRFLPSLLEERTEAGASAMIVGDRFRTELTLDWSDIERTGNVAEEDDESRENTRFRIDHRWDISDSRNLRLTYEHERSQSTYQGLGPVRLDTTRDEVRVEHEWVFGARDRYSFDLFARYNEESGDLARDEAEFSPRLTLRHTDRLKTTYRYGFSRSEQETIRIDQHKFDWAVDWQATDTLRLGGDVYWRYERVRDDVETYEYGGGVSTDLDAPTRWGRLTAHGAVRAIRDEVTGDGPVSIVRGETHALDGIRPTMLRKYDIRAGSIRAYNASRTRLYVPGIDYRVIHVGRLTTIYRVLSGRIADGEVVMFDYEYRVPTAAREDTYETELRIEHAFDFGLTPYYAWRTRRQFVDAERLPWIPALESDGPLVTSPDFTDNTDHHRMGLRYERSRWSFSGEYEIFDDSVLPYDAVHLIGKMAWIQSIDHALDSTVRFSRYHFTGRYDRRDVNWAQVDLSDRWQLTGDLSANVSAVYHYEDDSRDGITHGVDIEATVKLTRGLLDVELTAEVDVLRIGDDRDRGYGVWLNVRRDLSDATSRWAGR